MQYYDVFDEMRKFICIYHIKTLSACCFFLPTKYQVQTKKPQQNIILSWFFLFNNFLGFTKELDCNLSRIFRTNVSLC